VTVDVVEGTQTEPQKPRRRWTIDNRLALGGLVVAAIVALTGVVTAVDAHQEKARNRSTATASALPSVSPSTGGPTSTPSASAVAIEPNAATTNGPGTAKTPGRAPTTAAKAGAYEFDLELTGGLGYDLDPGRESNGCSGGAWRHPECRDLYRTSGDDDSAKLMGVPTEGQEDFNGIELVSASDTVERCRTSSVSATSGGNVPLSALSDGSRMCIVTRQGRRALLTVRGAVPSGRSEALKVHVTVLR
jgi:hypothetical protein